VVPLTLACALLGMPGPTGALTAALTASAVPVGVAMATAQIGPGADASAGVVRFAPAVPCQVPTSAPDSISNPTPPPIPTVILKKNPDVDDLALGQSVVLTLAVRASYECQIGWSVEHGWRSDCSMPAIIYRASDTVGMVIESTWRRHFG